MHYVALGDKHSRTQVGDTGRVWYSGSPEVTNFDDVEADPGHVLVVDVDEADPAHPVHVESHHVGRWRFVTLHRQVDDGRDIADLDLNLDLLPDKERTVVRLGLTGSLTVTDRAALDACLDKYARLFAWLGPWERHTNIAVMPADGEFDDLGIGGFAAAAVDELVGTARSGDGEAADDAQGALAPAVAAGRGERGMKLHRLVLTNYRGIAHRDIEFPDHGVVVVCGANEIGKTSMIEALDLLLESKDRSTKKEVKQVKPTHADVGSEVTAEISTGPYRFVYRKRFHKKCETELTMLAPRREQLTGDEAHDRVQAMLGETVDTGLWHAQRVLQAGSTAAVDLSDCDALSRALDVAAGDDAALSGTEPLLIERIDAEYGRYFTATGRPTGEWAATIAQLRTAEEDVARCTSAVAEVDERVRRHADLAERLAGLADHRQGMSRAWPPPRRRPARWPSSPTSCGRPSSSRRRRRAPAPRRVAAQAERVRLRNDVAARTAAVSELQAQRRCRHRGRIHRPGSRRNSLYDSGRIGHRGHHRPGCGRRGTPRRGRVGRAVSRRSGSPRDWSASTRPNGSSETSPINSRGSR